MRQRSIRDIAVRGKPSRTMWQAAQRSSDRADLTKTSLEALQIQHKVYGLITNNSNTVYGCNYFIKSRLPY